jgi:hypothetical protein
MSGERRLSAGARLAGAAGQGVRRMIDPGIAWHPARLARDAFALTFRGSRRDLEEVTARRVLAALVFLLLVARCVHLAQAGIDLAAGHAAYTRPGLAEWLAVACVAESVLFAVVAVRAQRLTLGALLGDALFGVAGLVVMSAATSAAPGRAGSLNWMLPYTVTTAVGLGLLAAGDAAPESGGPALSSRSGRWLLSALLARAAITGALAAAYMVSVSLPRRLPGDGPAQLWANAANYAVFFLAAVVLAVLLRRWLAVISRRNAEAVSQAARLSQEAYWRAVTVDVFGPVFDLLDSLAVIGEQVPASLQQEADRLINLIEAVNPLTGSTYAPSMSADPIDGGSRG